jgi:hypothetical protein
MEPQMNADARRFQNSVPEPGLWNHRWTQINTDLNKLLVEPQINADQKNQLFMSPELLLFLIYVYLCSSVVA